MLQIGKMNRLQVIRHADFGVYLDDHEGGEILLPLRYMPEESDLGDHVDVFVCYDSDDRLIALTQKPLAQVGEIATLEVVAVERVGAFLNWGLPKDLLLPFAEQIRELKPRQKVVVVVYLDNSGRIAASMKIEKHLQKQHDNSYEEGQLVNLLVYGKTDLGYKAVINGKHMGVIFANEVFQDLQYGQTIQGYIKKLREDGKIDLSLQRAGHESSLDIAPIILEKLKAAGGFLPLTDKTPPEKIYELFGVSKKKYKMALGRLYKKRLITVDEDGIRIKS